MNKANQAPERPRLWKLLEQGRPREVLEELAGQTPPILPVDVTLRGLAHYRDGDYPAAVEALEETLRLDPQNPVARLYLSLALYRAGESSRAGEALSGETVILPHREWLEEFLRTFWPLRFTTTLDMPMPLPAEGEWQDPYGKQYERAMAQRRENPEAAGTPGFGERRLAEQYLRKAEARYLAKDVPVAVRLMERAYDIAPGEVAILANLTFVYLLTGRGVKAFELLDPVMEGCLFEFDKARDAKALPPMELIVCYAWSLHETGSHEEALQLLAAVHPEGPEDLGAHFVASVCWLMLGNEERYREAFRIATGPFFIDTWEQILLPFVRKSGAWLREANGAGNDMTPQFQKPLEMIPHFSPRPWGGARLREVLGKNIPDSGEPIGESWELSDHPDGRSCVHAPGAKFDGLPLGEVLRRFPREMIGAESAPERYPLLVKYIDAAGDLSVQVHPDDAWCATKGHPDRGKSECWYVIDCAPGTRLIYGYREGVTEEEVRAALKEARLAEVLEYKTVEPGDFLAVPPGTVHAMLAGLLVCEIQQSSNTTFRLYDWDRQPPRELHIEESMEVTQWDSSKLPPIRHLGPAGGGTQTLIENEFFTVTLHDLAAGERRESAGLLHPKGAILNVVSGSGEMMTGGETVAMRLGSTFFLPAAMEREPALVAGEQGLRVLRSISRE